MGITHNLSSIAAPTKIFSFKKIFVHLSAVVDAVRGGRVWGAQVHHHVPLGPVIGGVSPEVSPLPHMVTSLQHPASLSLVLQKVASELHPKVRNHGEGPY